MDHFLSLLPKACRLDLGLFAAAGIPRQGLAALANEDTIAQPTTKLTRMLSSGAQTMKPLPITKIHTILYVKDQTRSMDFYSRVLNCEPALNVAGMTEFTLSESCVLGLMPEMGIKLLLGDRLPDPADAAGIPRAELYLHVADPLEHHLRALEAGATELSGLANRDWGDRVAYSLDPDGHVLAFAEKGN